MAKVKADEKKTNSRLLAHGLRSTAISPEVKSVTEEEKHQEVKKRQALLMMADWKKRAMISNLKKRAEEHNDSEADEMLARL